MKSKKSFCLGIILLLALCKPGFAQERNYRNEINFRYGILTVPGVTELMGSLLSEVITFGTYSVHNWWSTGAIGMEYSYSPKKWVCVGATLSFERTGSQIYLPDKEIKDGETSSYYYSLMGVARFNYLSKKIVTLYGRVGVGYTLALQYYTGTNSYQDYTGGMFAFQLSPIGVRVGTRVAGFFEAGFGTEGLVNFGLSVRL